MSTRKFISADEFFITAKEVFEAYNIKEFAVVHNPSYIYYPIEIYPMAPKIEKIKELKAVVMDMDGTTTTTEPLCLHSLEYMVRQISGKLKTSEWKGLDRVKDYPNVIGNSTTKHVEYLIKTYQSWIKDDLLIKSYIYAALWTLIEGQDENRKNEVRTNLTVLIEGNIFEDEYFGGMIKSDFIAEADIDKIFAKWKTRFKFSENFDNIVRAAIDIYYARYHFILKEIDAGLHREEQLIKPMPGVSVYLALISGLLGAEAGKVYNVFIKELEKKIEKRDYSIISENDFIQLGKYFEKKPVKVGIVTSSIYYEADIVLNEIFRIFKEEVEKWEISEKRKQTVLNRYKSYDFFYNAVITATDSSEIRLKPHRDLYSIALHRLGIQPEDFDKVVGFEDSESGTIAIRTAGIGLCVAVPFADTNFHNFDAATKVVYGGLPETVLRFNHWLDI